MRHVPAVSVLCAALIAVLAACAPSHAITRTLSRVEPGSPPYGLSSDCMLEAANICSGWIWVFSDVEGAIWGTILEPEDCETGCTGGGATSDIYLYSRCSTTPGEIASVGIATIDAVGCRTATLWSSPPLSIVHCVVGDRWTVIPTPLISVSGMPFAVTVTWGPQSGGVSNPQLATDNGILNLYCQQGPGTGMSCATSTSDCSAWVIPPQRTFVYVTDMNGDGILDDVCAIYGAPYPLCFPYVAPYGYLPNNMLVTVGLDCQSPSAVENTSWGGIKSLFR